MKNIRDSIVSQFCSKVGKSYLVWTGAYTGFYPEGGGQDFERSGKFFCFAHAGSFLSPPPPPLEQFCSKIQLTPINASKALNIRVLQNLYSLIIIYLLWKLTLTPLQLDNEGRKTNHNHFSSEPHSPSNFKFL